jgi:nucleotide-binding universal stress UspA family protein
MNYSTLLVHLDGGTSNGSVLDVAAAMAREHHARIIGIASCAPVHLGVADNYIDGMLALEERDIQLDELQRTRVEFDQHAAVQRHAHEFRSIATVENIAHVVAAHGRCADLLITGVSQGAENSATHANASDLVLQAGRPVLVVPEGNVTSTYRTVLVAWTDTRECRRAVADSLPALHHADRVVLVEMTSDFKHAQRSIDDVAAWLERHEVRSDHVVCDMPGSRAEILAAIAHEQHADLIVAGAYGHSRIGEWAFGGVTRELLVHAKHCVLLSH